MAARSSHRNLRSRTRMLAQVLQIFFGERTPCKNRPISTLDKVIYFKRTIFLQSRNPLFTSQNRAETSGNFFFQHASSRFKISMVRAPNQNRFSRENSFFRLHSNVNSALVIQTPLFVASSVVLINPDQGDQIGRIFATVIVYIGQLLYNYISLPYFRATFSTVKFMH
jgi:hypothetical protein